jgi:hypothetical protein
MITDVAPTLPQFTDAGFARLELVDAASVTTGVVVAGICVGAASWVQPATRRPATRQRPMMIRRAVFDIMIYQGNIVRY